VNKRHERPAFIAYVGGMAELKRIDETGPTGASARPCRWTA
jgi:hypothetical protein